MSGLLAIAVLVCLALLFGALLGWAAQAFAVARDPILDRIEELLPQTQCGQCGFPGCRPYAEAIANEQAGINLCPPGGEQGVQALAELLGREPTPLVAPEGESAAKRVALIIEEGCIGCTKCIQACPVDAIIGAPRLMHTVLADRCTGCELCIAPCPVDCIALLPAPPALAPARRARPQIPVALLH